MKMHSNIYGLVKLQEPKAIEVEPFNEDSIDFEDVSYFADYFKNNDNDFDAEVKWLTDFLKLDKEDIIKDNGETIIRLTKTKVKEYLERQYERFMNKVEDLDLDGFIKDSYSLRDMIDDVFSFHICVDGCLDTLDEFMRDLYRWTLKDKDVVYYQVNGILDYHY